MSKFRSLLAAVSILLCAATLPVNGGLPKRHPAIAGYFLFQQDIPAKTVVLKGQGSTPANPSAGWYKLFVDNAGALKLLDSAGGVTTFGTGGGGFELQTETSFANNSNAAIWLKGPVGSSTSFLNFFDSDNNQLVNINEAGIVYAQRFSVADGNYFSDTNSLYLKTNSGSYGVEIPRTGGIVFLPGFNGGAATAPSALVDSTQMTDGFSALSATNEHSLLWDNASLTHNWSTGAVATQRFFRIRPQTITATGASTFTNAATLSIGGAPTAGTNATITNPYALWVESGLSQFNGRINTVNSDASNPNIQAQNDTGTALRGISLSSYGAYLTSRSSIAANIAQTGTLSGNTTAATALIKREHTLSGFTSTGPVLQVEQATGTGNLLSLVNSGGTQAAFDQNGVLLIGGASSPGTNTKLQLGTPTTANNSVNIYLESTGAAIVPMAMQANSAQSADMLQIFNSAGTKTFYINAKGIPSANASGGVSNAVFGASAGDSLTGGQTNNTFIGAYSGMSVSTGSNNVLIGNNTGWADANMSNNIIIGSSMCDGSNGTANGPFLAIGVAGGDDIVANNVAVFGSPTAPYNDWYFGRGYSATATSDITFQPSIASGADKAGANFLIRGGAPTGDGEPGTIVFQAAGPPGSSGSTLRTQNTIATVSYAGLQVSSGVLQSVKFRGGSGAPSIAADAGAGTGPTVSLASGSTDTAGEIVVTTGTATTSGAFVTVTFASAYSTAPFVTLTPSNSATANIVIDYDAGWYVTRTTTGFTVNLNGALAISTEYKFNYHVVQ